MDERKTAIQTLTKTIEDLATRNTELEIENRELSKSADDWYKYFCDKKELAEKLAAELAEVKAELEAIKAGKENDHE